MGILSLRLEGEVGSEISLESIIREVSASSASEIELVINSGGGSVFAGFAIYDYFKNLDKKVSVRIEGMAASAASVIALAGDELPTMSENSVIMVHNAWTPVVSSKGMNSEEIEAYTEELKKQAELMDKINLKIAKVYANATGLELSKIQDMMAAETWIFAEEAKELGFINSVYEDEEVYASAFKAEADKYGYKNFNFKSINMSENKEGLLDQLKAYVADLLAPKAEAVEESVEETVGETQEVEAVEETIEEVEEAVEEAVEEPKDSVDVEAIKSELMAEIKAEVIAKEEAHASELAELKKELDKAKASRKPLEAKEDVSNPEAKIEEADELGAAILNILKSSFKA
ncbi:MAG: putative capsid assembly protease C [Prokaryotic dsDNA virus sp.]|nr:MAG: putative capsid assembly protease C [Prokaryotic dsDNA virus sp.]|tara:strand:- start:10827 stop:11864 length:1038 start_codon:yes stop_codon:yes gene_type:complete